jgi:hypothetical protein
MSPSVRQVLLVVAMGVATACGGGATPGTASRPAEDQAAGDYALDQAIADRANLQAADLPADWSSRPREPLPGEDALRPDIARCLGLAPPSERATAEARSPDFTQQLATVSSLVLLVETEAEARADAAAFTGGGFPACAEPGYGAQIHSVAPPGNTVTNLAVTPVDFPSFGDQTVAHRVTAVVDMGHVTIPINIDLVHIFKGRAQLELVVVAPGVPFPADFVVRLAEAMAGRV